MMQKLWALFNKDLLLLWRDKIGLANLFIMPMFFVLIITLLQTQHLQQNRSITLFMQNNDTDSAMQKMYSDLQQNHAFNIIQIQASQLADATQTVKKGNASLLVIIPAHLSERLTANIQQQMIANQAATRPPAIQLIFDPALSPALQNSIVTQLTDVIHAFQMQVMANITHEVLGTQNTPMQPQALPLQIEYAGTHAQVAPDPVQQNVPAWALFGMFMITLPLASIMIKERSQAVALRLYLTPVSNILLIASRMLSFMSINFLQLWMMLLVGIFILPLFHLAPLNVAGHVGRLCLVGVFAALSAVCSGLLAGTWLKSHEQAATFIPILIVLAAAIGGILFPLWLMPPIMQKLAVLSPLNWAHQAFIAVLVRDAPIQQLVWPLSQLGIFSIVLCLLAWWKSRHL